MVAAGHLRHPRATLRDYDLPCDPCRTASSDSGCSCHRTGRATLAALSTRGTVRSGHTAIGWVLRCWVHPIPCCCIFLVCPITDRGCVAHRPSTSRVPTTASPLTTPTSPSSVHHRHHRRILRASSPSHGAAAMLPHRAATPPPVCSLRHCIYIAVPYASTTVLRNL
jgi:hypothetical protein